MHQQYKEVSEVSIQELRGLLHLLNGKPQGWTTRSKSKLFMKDCLVEQSNNHALQSSLEYMFYLLKKKISGYTCTNRIWHSNLLNWQESERSSDLQHFCAAKKWDICCNNIQSLSWYILYPVMVTQIAAS